MRPLQETSRTSICYIISAIICFVEIAFGVTAEINQIRNNGFNSDNSLIIAFMVWLLVNLITSIFAVIGKQSSLRCYLLINELVVAIVGVGLLVISTVVWLITRGDCSGEYCPIIDIIYLGILGVILVVGIPEFFLLSEAKKVFHYCGYMEAIEVQA